MIPKPTIKILLSLFFLAIINKGVNAQITLLQDYKNNYSATIGTFQGIKFREGGFSGMYPIPNTGGKEFWIITDRGVNVDGANANPSTCRPTYDKIYGFPSYAPKIFRVKLNGDSVQILKTITVKRPGGSTATGLLNPTGFGSTATEVISTDTVLNCANFNLKTASKDIWGIDAEGLIVDKDGNFWVCEEGGPTIWKLDPNGLVLLRFSPYASKVGAQAQDIYIDSCFGYRKNNRGFEGLSITPNGKIYAMIQSPILYPNKTIGEGTRVHRLLEIDPLTNTSKMYVYLNEGIIGASGSNQIRLRDWKIGDMAAINDSTFLVIEHALRGTTDRKNIFTINISGATVVTSGLYSGKTVEALVDSTGLASNSIKPVKKQLFMDMLANGWSSSLDKPEGLAIINDSTIAIGNDNDYGQASLPEDGIAVATGNLCHVYTYGLKGINKLKGFRNGPSTGAGPSSSATPYLEGVATGVKTNAIMTVGDSVKGGYRMAGLPDGLGAYDNNDGTFTLLANHEMNNAVGAVHAHGSKGAFVSKWVINKNTMAVQSGSDLVKKVKLWKSGTYKDTTTAFNRFCAGDLPLGSAFYNAATGLGTQERIFMNGEEAGAEGRAFGHIVTGTNAGTTYELPYLGKFSWENSIASPYASNKTVVAGTDDATPGQVYMYIGTKTNSGTEIEKAGLSGGKLFGVKVSGMTAESSSSIPTAGTAFSLYDFGQVHNTTGATLNTASDAAGVTAFLRPEDGAWDPSNPNDFYFVTTNSFTAPSRLWKLHFTDIANPENGGTITAVLDGTEGPKMMDNMVIDKFGHVMIQEDPGNQSYLAKIWQYTIATDAVKEIARHDANRFITGGSSYLTQDEESSGIVDMQDILGAGMFVYADQAHYSIPGDLVEGGQFLTLYNPDTYNASKGAGPSSSATPYLEGVATGVKTNAIMTVGDSVKGGYRMAGLPDGLGAYDNNDGTFTLLANHEMNNAVGAVHAHGSKGAFVSKWVINKNTMAVQSGSDLVKKVKLWKSGTYKDTTTAFNRFCAGDLPLGSAFYNAATGLGTQERIFMNGEEAGAEGRAFGHIVTGTNAGTTYELPYLGKFSWENSIASPYASNKTVVAGTDDATPGQVYMYIGTKTNSGTEIEKAGLSGGKLFGVKVSGMTAESSSSIPTAGTAFSLYDFGQVHNTTGATLNTASDAAGVTAFLRPEDGAWDPSNPNDFYFVTTNSFTAPSRLWKLHFTDIANPENGGTITAVLDGTEGPKMMDNMVIDKFGHVMIQEDPGNQSYLAKIWQYTIATDAVKEIARHDANRFITGGSSYLTQDEESSGIVDMQDILGAGMFVYADQAHYSIPGDLVEGGQFLTLYNPDTYNASKGAGPSSSATPYLEGVATGVKTNAIMTVGDSVKGGYRMAGLPDGLGAYDNNDGTFTLLANHEMNNAVGAVHAHGSKGAFVSKWVINKNTMAVQSGSDLVKKVKLWKSGTYKDTTTAFNRFCAGDLPLGSAFYNAATGLGTQERIFMNGEESGAEGRAFGHIVTGTNAGTTYELPYLGKFSWENSIASPYASNKTVVAGTDDATPGQVYMYIGTKTNSGTEIEKAGLSGGKLFGVKVSGMTAESSSSIPTAGTAFSLYDFGQVHNTTGATLNTASDAAGVTAFLRPEDGAWDPSNPNDFYFVTTNSFTAPSRLWKLHFTDIANPENGGTITAVLDGTEGPKMMDNMVIDKFGHIMIQEDPGNQSYLAKIWQYTIATDAVKEIARHDANRFISGGSSYLTQDEESSGIVDMQDILGAGMFVYADQAHYSIPGDLVEGGQFLTLYNPDTYNSNPEISVVGNKINIANGDVTPATTDNTDYGTVNAGSSVNKTFVIKNAGPGTLIVKAINFSGTNAAEFTLVSAPSFPLNILVNDSLTITVKFAPLASGLRTATLNINNNDNDEGTYQFSLQGTSVSAEINLQGNNVNIATGSTTPTSGNNTDFGTVAKGSTLAKAFVIQNTGTAALSVSGISFTGTNAGEFTLVNPPSFPLSIASSGSQTINVQFAPTGSGTRSATINIANNDLDEASYTFALQGNGNTSGIKQVVNSGSLAIAPNPFDQFTSVKLSLVSDAKVAVMVYNILGEQLETLVNTNLNAGDYNFSLGTGNLNYAAGMYLVKVIINDEVTVTRVIKSGN